MIKAIIFDIDGVLADTETLHWLSFNDALDAHNGQPLSFVEHQNIYKGMSSRKKLEMLCERRNRLLTKQAFESILSSKQLFFYSRIVDMTPTKDKIELMEELKTLGYTLVACTNNCSETALKILETLELSSYFSAVIARDSPGIKAAKPAADLYLAAVEAAESQPLECLVVEDSEVGLESARAAGTHTWKVAGPEDVNLTSLLAEIYMAQRVNVVVPAAGWGKRFSEAGYFYPKPLIPYRGKPMVQLVAEMFLPAPECHIVMLMQNEHLHKYRVEEYFREALPGCEFVGVNGRTEGAACTVLLAEHLINNDNELVVVNSDQVLETDIPYFLGFCRGKNLYHKDVPDGALITFEVPENDPKWSFVRTEDNSPTSNCKVLEVAEKVQISNLATAGVYYWRKGSVFFEYARRMIAQEERVNGEFYVAPIYNHMIKDGLLVKCFNIQPNEMLPMGTPEDFKRTTARWNKENGYV